MKYKISTGAFLFIFIILVSNWLSIEAQTCNPSGRIVGKQPPPGQCNKENQSDCCKRGKLYTTYKYSPQVSQRTKATLTINSFEKGGDGGRPSECDDKYHPDNTRGGIVNRVVQQEEEVLGLHYRLWKWKERRAVEAKVVDECDSTMGCDADHDYQPPCPNNIVDASKAVWKALGVPESDWGEMEVQWSDV